MKKLLLSIVLLISFTPISVFAALDPTVYDYGYFGVTKENPKSSIIWADYPYNKHQWETVNIESDGRYILRLYDKKGKIILQNIQQGSQSLTLTDYKPHGIQIQLSKTTGSYARFSQATTTNPNAQTVNFLETNDEF